MTTTARPDSEPGERIDALGIRDWQIIQREDEFRFSLDAVLLAHFASVRSGARVVDLGTGSGAVALFVLSRGAGSVSGLDNNPRLAAMATRSADLNGLAGQLSFVCGDVKQIDSYYPVGCCDLVTTNPPYRTLSAGRLNPSATVAQARHETTAGLLDFVRAAGFLLRNRGRFAMIHLPERLTDICVELRTAGLEPKRLRLVHPFSDRPAKMLMVEAVKGAKPGLIVLPPLVVYQAPKQYSREILAYYK
jgi:tRNA1(Val) A37 N6-methylase TrmN6